MNIEIRFFASVREAVGVSTEMVTVPEQVRTVGDVRVWLVERGGAWADVLAEGKAVRMAHNQQMIDAATPITEGSEVAFFPPVTGG